MKESEVLQTLSAVGAVITDSHIVYTSGKHGTAYVNKDAVYVHPLLTAQLCREIALNFDADIVEVVVAPAVGGVILSTWVAYLLTHMTGREVRSIYAEKSDMGEGFVLKRGYAKEVVDKRVLVVEDVLTTGGTVRKVIEAVLANGGIVVGLGVLCNRGGVTPHDVADVPKLIALTNVKLDAWNETDCPRCKDGVPINTDVGKGREFLDRQRPQA